MFASFNARAVGLTLSASETITLAARAGFAGVDLLVRDLLQAGDDPRALRRRMDDLGLRGGAFQNPVEWRRDAPTFARDLAQLPRLAEAAAELGLGRTATWVLPETPVSPAAPRFRGTDSQAAVAMHVERLGAIARVLETFDIRLGLEVIGVASSRTGRGLPFITRLADLPLVLTPIGKEAPNVGIVLDAWHLYAAGEPIEAGFAWGVAQVVCTHIADLPAAASRDRAVLIDHVRGLPGENGAIDCKSLLQRLHDAGYEGPVIAEPMPGCRTLAGLEPEPLADRVAEALRLVWPSPWR